jgi:hypothetical protein
MGTRSFYVAVTNVSKQRQCKEERQICDAITTPTSYWENRDYSKSKLTKTDK